MASLFRVVLARIRACFRSGDLDRDFDQELATHLTMAEDDKRRRGMTRAQARREARVELGGVTQLREASRAARGLPWLGTFWLDVKLGIRMLRKSWGLTLVGGLAMTVMIAIAGGAFSFFDTAFRSQLPLDEGDRVVALMTWDAETNRRRSPSLPDLERWREEARSLEDIGGVQTIEQGLAIADGPAEPVAVAQMTASGFQLARVPPLLGRPLVAEDERDDAAPVVVIGHEAWRTRFAFDPSLVGRQVRLDRTLHTVVGVMPEGFAFPVNHRFWTPLRVDPSRYARNAEPAVFGFARLAPDATLAGAQAELATLGVLPPVTVTETDEQLHPRVAPYSLALVSTGEENLPVFAGLVLLIVTLLMVPPCANVAILVYAKTVARQEEFATRYALGASRGRIVAQLFVEMLLLATGAAGVALVVVRLTGEYLQSIITMTNGVPFWFDFGNLSIGTVLFAAGLAALAATLAGVVPARRATARLMQSGLRALGGRTGMQLGTTWTALVVAQVAFCLAILPVAAELAWGTLRPSILGPGFAADEFLTARLALNEVPRTRPSLEIDVPVRPIASRFADLQGELGQRLESEPGISALTVSATMPGSEPWAIVELDGVSALQPPGGGPIDDSDITVLFNRVDDVFFDTFEVPLLAGRGFSADDFALGRTAVIVNRMFAQQIVGDGPPLGRRIRYVRSAAGSSSESDPWYEIVGVVDDLPANTYRRRLYHPMAPGEVNPVSIALRAGPTSANTAARVRELTTALDPALRVDELRPLDEVYLQYQRGNNIGAYMLAAVAVSVLLLSAAGMYALMSFTVARRRREIGIRTALGAQPTRLLAGIFKRALTQVAVGAGAGALAARLLGIYLPIEEMGGWSVPGILPAAATLMVVVAAFAAIGPARRGLRIEPTEALRDG